MILLALVACVSRPPETLTVLAASSLTEAFEDLESAFERQHPEVDVVVATGGSQTLAMQVRHGIEAGVIASADPGHLDGLRDDGFVDEPRPFATNVLVIAVRDRDLALEMLPSVERLVVGAPEVPVGRYARALLERGGETYGPEWRSDVEARVVSQEPNSRLVAAKVALGEADAAIVYRTDVRAVSGVRGIELTAGMGPTAVYAHARIVGSDPIASAWIEHVESDEGKGILASHGFTP